MTKEHLERRLAAIFAADVVGSCRLIGKDEEGALAQLKEIRKKLFDPKITNHRGRIVKNTGDGALAEFGSVVDAVRCAVDLQRGVAERNIDVPHAGRIEFRIGIHIGDIIIEDDDIYGDGVNIAVRLEGIAEPGGVCISDDVHRQIRGKVNFILEDMGPRSLRNIVEPMRVWRLPLANSPAAIAKSSADVAEPLPLPDKPSIAVLPFQNMSGDPEQEYFADGMVEDIITGLSRSKSLFVIARQSTFTYKGKAVDVRQVGRDLGVRYVLEGSVRKAGNRVRITGQLIDAATGLHLWAERFDGQLEDVFDLQDRVTSSVICAISPRLERAEIERAKRKRTDNLQAYDYYLRALANLYQFTREANIEALKLSATANGLDPEFAISYALGATCYIQRKVFGWSTEAAQERAEARSLATRAIQLDNQDPMVLAMVGDTLAYVLGEVEEGAKLIWQAIDLNPNYATARNWGGWAYLWLGDVNAAIDQFHAALRLDPRDPWICTAQSGLAFAHFFAGRNEEASLWAATAIKQRPDHVAAYRVMTACHVTSGQIEEARQTCKIAMQLDPSQRISRFNGLFRRTQDIEKLARALRIAGMPE
jgi:TolB-like protein/class 3 adenylate cyclase